MSNVVPFQGSVGSGTLGNPASEALLLGALLIDNSRIAATAKILEPAHFFEPMHGRIYAKITEIFADTGALNAATLRPHFENDEAMREMGGVVYLARLSADGDGLLATREIAEQILDLAWRRDARAALIAAAERCLDLETPAQDIASGAEAKISLPDGLGAKNGSTLPGIADIALWAGSAPPARRFILPGWIVRGSCGLLSGQEGVGKSLIAQQMATCAAVGLPFMGLDIAKARALYITCEDPSDELWRRQENINSALGIRTESLIDRMMLVSLKGELSNELATFDGEGRITVSQRYKQIEKAALDFGAEFIFLDNAAHLFTGNENARHDVAVFLGLLEKLSERINGAVVLLAHPNKQHAQGNKQGNEYSGSTGWSAHVRNRLFLDWAQKDDEGNFIGEDGRVLRKSKANYGKSGEEIHFRWHDWAFVRDADLPDDVAAEMRQVSRANFENGCFIECLKQRLLEHRAVSESPTSRTYAPKIFSEMPEARGTTKEQMQGAMDRLFRLKTIERGFLWVDKGEGKSRHGLKFTPKAPENSSADLSADLPPTSDEGDDE